MVVQSQTNLRSSHTPSPAHQDLQGVTGISPRHPARCWRQLRAMRLEDFGAWFIQLCKWAYEFSCIGQVQNLISRDLEAFPGIQLEARFVGFPQDCSFYLRHCRKFSVGWICWRCQLQQLLQPLHSVQTCRKVSVLDCHSHLQCKLSLIAFRSLDCYLHHTAHHAVNQ